MAGRSRHLEGHLSSRGPAGKVEPKTGRPVANGSSARRPTEKASTRVVALHSRKNEQLTYILEGTLRLWLGEDEAEIVDVKAGEVLHIPANLPHRAEALEDTLD